MTTSRCPCADFPNENPFVDAGVVRVHGAPCSCRWRPKAEDLVARYGTLPGLAPQLFWALEGEPSGVEEPLEAEFDAPLPPPEETLEVDIDTSDAERAPEDGFGSLIQAMRAVLLAAGATRAAAVLGQLMRAGSVESAKLGERGHGSVAAVLRVAGEKLCFGDADEQIRGAWRRVLSGEADDLSACGTGTLDRWAAAVVAELLGAPLRADEIRRELRRRGVAAFGMLEAA